MDDNQAELAETGSRPWLDANHPPSRFFFPWLWGDWTPEQFNSWSESKREAVISVPSEIWHLWSKKDRDDYAPRMNDLRLMVDLYAEALAS